MQHDAVLEPLRQAATLAVGLLDELHLVIVLQGLCQRCSDVAAASDHDPFVGLVDPAQLRHDRTDIVTGSDEENLIVHFYNGITLWDDGAILSIDGRNPGIHVGHVPSYLLQLVPDDRASVVGAHGNQLHPPFGEVHHLEGARCRNKARDAACDELLGADDDIDGYVILVEQLFLVSQVVGRANPGNLGWCFEQGVSHLTGHHVDLVAIGHGDEHVCVFGSRLAQSVGMRGATCHSADVQPLL